MAWRGSLRTTCKPRLANRANRGRQEMPVASLATGVTPHAIRQVARALRALRKAPKRRTAWGSRGAGTATQGSDSPIAMPAAWRWRTASAAASAVATRGASTGAYILGIKPRTGGMVASEVRDARALVCRRPSARQRRRIGSLPHGIRTMPVPNGVVASSRDHPGKRARSTIDTTVSMTAGLSARIAQRLRMALFLITCVAAPPPIPFQA